MSSEHDNLAHNVLFACADAVLLLDDQHRVVFANPAAIELFGDRVSVGRRFDDARSGELARELVVPSLRGATVVVEMRVASTTWQGRPAAVVSFRDVTERRAAREHVDQKNRMLSAIREVNQLSVKEKEPRQLARRATETLVRTRGCEGAWIALADNGGLPSFVTIAGFGDGTKPFRTLLERRWPGCMRFALERPGCFPVTDPQTVCAECPLVDPRRQSVVTVLRRDESVFGLLGVSYASGSMEAYECRLVEQIGADIALALHDIDKGVQRQRAVRETTALLAANQAVLACDSFDAAATRILEICLQQTGAAAGHVALRRTAELEPLVVAEKLAAEGGDSGLFNPQMLRAARNEVYRSNRAVLDSDPSHGRYLLLAPIILEGQVRATIALAGKAGPESPLGRGRLGPVGADDARHVSALAEVAAIALHRSLYLQALDSSQARQKAAREQARLYLDIAAVILLGLDAEGRISLLNRRGCEVLGFESEEQALGKTWLDLVPRGARVGAQRSFEAIMRGEIAEHRRVESEIETIGGERRKVVWHNAVVPGPSGGIVGTLASGEDVTERREMEAQLAQADRLASMGMLAAGVAHEINNPLLYILYSLDVLALCLPELVEAVRNLRVRLAQQADSEHGILAELAEAYERIDALPLDEIVSRVNDALEGTRRIRDIASALSTFSRIEKNELVSVELPKVIDTAVNMAFNEIKYRARLIKDCRPVPSIKASEGRLSQVFLNLIINATHAIDEGRVEQNEIRVRTWSDIDSVYAEVKDTGCGIPQENLPRVFEPFFTTKKIGEGSGLGLSISKNIVETYGGSISVESVPSVGTTFTLRFPIRRASAKAAPTAEVKKVVAPARAGRLLIVDDEPSIRRTLATVLREHETVQAASGAAAQTLLAEDQAFDVILCDMMMPDVSGMDLHLWLVDRYPTLAERVVFITGGAFTPRARSYLSEVKNVRFGKPFDLATLIKTVAELVAKAG